MKAASSGLLSLLASRQFFSVDLFLFNLNGGAQLRYCSGDKEIVWNALTWNAGNTTGPYFIREGNNARCHWRAGIEVDTLTFDVMPGTSSIAGVPFLAAIQRGAFDGAELTLYRAFMPTYGNTAEGTVTMFAGRVAEIDIGDSVASFSVNSHLELLNQKLPRNLYQAGCLNTLFDAGCGLNSGGFAVTGITAADSQAYSIRANLAQETGYFDLGRITFTSGANSGLSRTVKAYSKGTPSTISLIAPFPSAPSVADNFTIYPGCDKQQSTCAAKFANLNRFRGFPYIPENSTAV